MSVAVCVLFVYVREPFSLSFLTFCFLFLFCSVSLLSSCLQHLLTNKLFFFSFSLSFPFPPPFSLFPFTFSFLSSPSLSISVPIARLVRPLVTPPS
ncbi:hypothetical protein BKA57DRAFT_201527 [Linnemannia elongata]|nr:hypothetical protein BKA57DRAFT_201527 [Linnemannia elongata]